MPTNLVTMANEEWKPVADWPHYEVSSLGRVWSCHRGGALLKAIVGAHGYLYVCLHRGDGKPRWGTKRPIHQLVALAHVGPKPSDGHEVDHINNDRADNRADNLRWVTRQENLRERNVAKGSRAGPSKLTEADIAEIRKRRGNGERLRVIAAEYGVSPGTICVISQGKTWRHVS